MAHSAQGAEHTIRRCICPWRRKGRCMDGVQRVGVCEPVSVAAQCVGGGWGGADQEQPMGLELGFAARWMLALVRVAGVGGDQIRGSATRDT